MNTILSLGDYRQAALYFDNVIPLSFYIEESPRLFALTDVKAFEEHISKIDIEDITPSELNEHQFYQDLHDMSLLMFKQLFAFSEMPEAEAVIAEMGWKKFEIRNEFSTKAPAFMKKYKLEGLPFDLSDELAGKESGGDEVLVSIPNMNFIDTEKLSWEKIIEFRKDKEALSKLRLFRTFVFDNYQNKSKSYVEDDILRRLDDYNSTVKKWKFDTYHGCLNSVLTSKSMAGAMTGSFLSALVSAPTTALLAGVTGASVEIGKTILQVSKCRMNLRETLSQNPISYIADLRVKTE